MRDAAFNVAALGDKTLADFGGLCNIARRHGLISGVDLMASRAVDIECRMLAEQIHIGFPKAGDRSDVLPIALKPVSVELVARIQNGRDDIFAEVIFAGAVSLVRLQERLQHAPFEDVDAHGRIRALGLFRLLFKFIDGTVLAGIHDAEAGGLLQRNLAHGNGAVGIALLMEAKHGGVVHLIDVVAGQNQHVIGVIALDKGNVLIDGVGRALIPLGVFTLGIGRKDLYAAVRGVQAPRLAVADVLVELQWLVLGQNTDRVNFGVYAVGKREIDDAVFAAERDGRLGRVFRQNHQTAALTTCQEHGDTTFFLELHSWISSCFFLCSCFISPVYF